MKKILSLVLAAAMVLSLVTMTGFASWTAENTPVAVLSVEGVDSADCKGLVPGDQVEVTLTISGLNTDWNGVQAQLNYDAGKFTLGETDVSAVQALFGGVELDTGVSGEVALASAISALDEDEELPEDIVIMSAVFTVNEGAAVGAAEFSISTSDANNATPYRLAFTKESGLEAVTTSTDDLTETVTIAEASTPSAKIGDVNLDGEITSADITALACHVAKVNTITDAAALTNADTNGDGEVASADLTLLAQYVAKIIDSF